uniref:Thymidylate kinase n=1 Tax=Ornithodoros turicata TaxID=34597 RepID=A0A2R5LBH5_9ACAR
MKSIQRGLFIVFEGCDHTGKSTQARLLSEALRKAGHTVENIAFPNRETETGHLLDQYLKSKTALEDHAVHLLFSANRWEAAPRILSELGKGTTIIADRYAYSGVAFSASKSLDFKWCQQCDVGLPEPDLLLYLSASADVVARRGKFGSERYERSEFQENVLRNYEVFAQLEKERGRWVEIDANKSESEVHNDILGSVFTALHFTSFVPCMSR